MSKKSISTIIMVSISFVVSIIALILAIVAYNQSTIDIDEVVKMQLEEDRQDIERQISLAEAKLRLMSLRSQIEAQEFSDDVSNEISKIRSDLRVAYEDSKDSTYEFWQEIDSDLDRLGLQIRDESADSLDSLNEAIDKMESRVDVSKEQSCINEGGEWKQFSNACADKCSSEDVCAQVITNSCDCGVGSCWNGFTCEPI